MVTTFSTKEMFSMKMILLYVNVGYLARSRLHQISLVAASVLLSVSAPDVFDRMQ